MKSLDDMPLEEAIALYYEKHHAIKKGDMTTLLVLKQKCPELFEKENDTRIENIIHHAKTFQASDRYKELCRLELKKALSIIKNDSIKDNK